MATNLRPTITDIRTHVNDAMVTNLWAVTLTPPASVPGASTFGDLNFRAISAEAPKRGGNSLEISIRGHKVKQPGDYDYSGQISLTLVESDIGSPVHWMISAWRERIIQSNTNYMHRTGDIKTTMELARLNRQNVANETSGTVWRCYGVYLEDYELGDMSDTGDIVQPSMTLSYDWFEDFVATVSNDSTTPFTLTNEPNSTVQDNVADYGNLG
jgi:hypothetical protein